MNARSALLVSAAAIVACFAAIMACGTTHPVRATAFAVAGTTAIAVFLVSWRRVFRSGGRT